LDDFVQRWDANYDMTHRRERRRENVDSMWRLFGAIQLPPKKRKIKIQKKRGRGGRERPAKKEKGKRKKKKEKSGLQIKIQI